eukprot:bmy_11849T0
MRTCIFHIFGQESSSHRNVLLVCTPSVQFLHQKQIHGDRSRLYSIPNDVLEQKVFFSHLILPKG